MIEALNGYYSPLETLLTLLAFENLPEDFAERWLRGAIGERLGEEFPRSRDPYTEYAMRTLSAQDVVRDQIKAYLARPWWRRWFGK